MERIQFRVAFTHEYLNENGQLAYGDVGLHLLNESPLIAYGFLSDYKEVVTPEQIRCVNGLAIIYPHITRATFSEGSEDLTIIARCGAGYDRIDVDACTSADVALVNAPEAMRVPTASAALMFILVLAKRLWDLDRLVRRGQWDLRGHYMGTEPNGKTLGIVGFGSIGQELASQVAPLGMRILAYDPYLQVDKAKSLNVTMVSLDILLKESDFVSLHCLLTDETRGMIGARELALMKPTAYLINMARGPVVDHQAIVDALTKHQIAGAGLDVFSQEPLPVDDPLTRLDNVVLSPHWAAGTIDVFQNAGISNAKDFLKASTGNLPDHIVNRDVTNRPGFQMKLARFKQ